VNTIKLERVQYVPKQLSPGILYGPAEWSFTEKMSQPSLWPSVGNWQLPCRSHYIIGNGHIHWAGAWSDAQIAAGRSAEEQSAPSLLCRKGPDGRPPEMAVAIAAKAIRTLNMLRRFTWSLRYAAA
jgi:hypothetical protein